MGDRFTVVYETFNDQGKQLRTGRVLAAEFVNSGKVYQAVYFQHADGTAATTRWTARTYARRSCGLRWNSRGSLPVSPMPASIRCWASGAHKGIDYGAPAGTRVKATGDGIVEVAGRQGAVTGISSFSAINPSIAT